MEHTYMEKLNPVWVKEVRQIEQSLLFKVAYILMIFWSVSSSLFFLSVAPEMKELSKVLFTLAYSAFLFCCMLVIPAQILFSSNRRWSIEKTEFLQLSSLRPGQIVMGRFWIALTQIGVFLSVFLPFIALLLLIPGLDYANIVFSISTAIMTSLVACAVAIATGWLLPHPLINTILSLCVLIAFMFVSGLLLSLSVSELNNPSWSNVAIGIGICAFLTMLIGGGALTVAVLRLRHAEENKSAPLRILLLAGSVLTSVIAIVIDNFAMSAPNAGTVFLFMGYLLLYPIHMILVTEPNVVGKRVYFDYQQKRSRFPILSVPTGGNAVLLSTALFFIYCFSLFILDTRDEELVLAGINTALVAYFSMLYLSGFFFRWFENWVARLLVGSISPILLLFVSLIPIAVGEAMHEKSISEFSPLFFMFSSFQDKGGFGFLGASFLAIIGFVINIPRISDAFLHLRSMREEDAA